MAAQSILLVHPDDDMVVALRDLAAGESISLGSEHWTLPSRVAAKHKFARRDLAVGQTVKMYGLVVGRTLSAIEAGGVLTTENVEHATAKVGTDDAFASAGAKSEWLAPDISRWQDRRFAGIHRSDGRVGTANYWVVVPLVFCENRNLQVMADALLEELGYGRPRKYHEQTRELVRRYRDGADSGRILETTLAQAPTMAAADRVFPNLDGIKFLRHDGGCGGAYADAVNLCGLLAGYINHPNVAGATVLSLGCQKSQIETLESELHKRNSKFDKPFYIFDQQAIGTEAEFVSRAIRHTFAGLMIANESVREPAELKHLCLGVECGASDGFSGLSANPAMGHCSDLLVGLGGRVILSEFPELAGCEADLMNRCTSPQLADRFLEIMRGYDSYAKSQGEGFDANPSPGNIKDGLITDAMKSAGAARKGGTSPVVDVLDFPQAATKPGLSLLCTPGGDVESTTAKAGSGANVMWFSTGLGTPTGNPICPVLKVSTNRSVAGRMPDIIDLNAGGIIDGEETIEQVGERMLEMVIATASGEYVAKAQRLGQDDFIPWKKSITF